MSLYSNIIDRLPSLYRPDKDAQGLFVDFMKTIGSSLAEVQDTITEVLQSHWFSYADRALLNQYFLLLQSQTQGKIPGENDPQILSYSHIHDLGYIASLVSIIPWYQTGQTKRESTEEFRQRITRLIQMYRNGLGTIDALRALCESVLLVEQDPLHPYRERPFTIEECAPLVTQKVQAKVDGIPSDILGPLMQWKIHNKGVKESAPTFYIEGVTAETEGLESTENIGIELLKAGTSQRMIALAYQGIIPPQKHLRIQPAYQNWLFTQNQALLSESIPSDDLPADPTAVGNWTSNSPELTDTLQLVVQTKDRSLWGVSLPYTNDDQQVCNVWHYNGISWTSMVQAPQTHCLTQVGNELIFGTIQGLYRIELYKDQPGEYTLEHLSDFGVNESIYTIYRDRRNIWWLGTDNGVYPVDRNGQVGTPKLLGIPVYCVTDDDSHTLYFGTERGLIYYQTLTDSWYWLCAEHMSEHESDWQQFSVADDGTIENQPDNSEIFLPRVTAIFRSPDSTLWIGTDAGLARYIARKVKATAYTTTIEAFPELINGKVSQISEDQRGNIWFCTHRGAFCYDGRDMYQIVNGEFSHLGRADKRFDNPAEPRGSWRYAHALGQWEQFHTQQQNWLSYEGSMVSAEQDEVMQIVWTDTIVAHLGTWDGTAFTAENSVAREHFITRFKPWEGTIVTGGIPSLPRIPTGSSVWRCLKLEDPNSDYSDYSYPSWTCEGRLLGEPSPNVSALLPGRFDGLKIKRFNQIGIFRKKPQKDRTFDSSLYAYNPCAKIWMTWEERNPNSLMIRLRKFPSDSYIDSVLLDQIWEGVQRVKPLGIMTMVSVNEKVVRGG